MESNPPKSKQDKESQPDRKCDYCGTVVLYVGKLPSSGLKPALRVFRCRECHLIVSEII